MKLFLAGRTMLIRREKATQKVHFRRLVSFAYPTDLKLCLEARDENLSHKKERK